MMCCVLKFANLCMDIGIFRLLWISYKIISCMNFNYGMIGYNLMLMICGSVRKNIAVFLFCLREPSNLINFWPFWKCLQNFTLLAHFILKIGNISNRAKNCIQLRQCWQQKVEYVRYSSAKPKKMTFKKN